MSELLVAKIGELESVVVSLESKLGEANAKLTELEKKLIQKDDIMKKNEQLMIESSIKDHQDYVDRVNGLTGTINDLKMQLETNTAINERFLAKNEYKLNLEILPGGTFRVTFDGNVGDYHSYEAILKLRLGDGKLLMGNPSLGFVVGESVVL